MVVVWYLVFLLSCILKAFLVECQSITLINPHSTLHWYLSQQSTYVWLMDVSQLTLADYWQTVDQVSLIDTPLTPWLTFHWHLGRRSTYTWLMHMSQLTHSQLFTNCWESVDRVSTEYWSGCWSGTGQDVDQGYQWTADSFTTHDWFFYFIFPCFF